MLLGSKDLAEKNLLQYKDVFSDIVNVNLFGGRHYISANELSREPGELITKSSSDNKLKQLQMDVPMKCPGIRRCGIPSGEGAFPAIL